MNSIFKLSFLLLAAAVAINCNPVHSDQEIQGCIENGVQAIGEVNRDIFEAVCPITQAVKVYGNNIPREKMDELMTNASNTCTRRLRQEIDQHLPGKDYSYVAEVPCKIAIQMLRKGLETNDEYFNDIQDALKALFIKVSPKVGEACKAVKPTFGSRIPQNIC